MSAYEAIAAARASHLKMFELSAAHARHEMVNPREPSAALDLGQATHCAILEPDRFAKEWAEAPKVDRRTKAGKAQWAEFVAQAEGRQVLKASDYQTCLRLREAVYSHPTAGKLLSSPGAAEATILWQDDECEIECKGRLDYYTKLAGWPCIVDVKTTRRGDPNGFAREIAAHSYHVQAAFYLEGLEAIEPNERRFFFIAVENFAPYCVGVYELDDQALDQGRRDMRRYLRLYAEATQKNVWPGYADGPQVLTLPAWAVKGEPDVGTEYF
jgi:hypothetical protein